MPRAPTPRRRTALNSSPVDNQGPPLAAQRALAATVAATASVTIWSEVSVALSGCGPLALPDAAERAAYVAVILASGAGVFSRIVLGQAAADVLFAEAAPSLRNAERLSLLTWPLAYATLAAQYLHGQQISPTSLSGVDELFCAALR